MKTIAKKVQRLKGTRSIWKGKAYNHPSLRARAKEVEGLGRSNTMISFACSPHTGK